MGLEEREAIRDPALLIKCGVVLAAVFTAFIAHSALHIAPSVVALLGAGVLVLIARMERSDYLSSVEWETLLFFAGLFIMVGSLVKTGVVDQLARAAIEVTGGNALLTVMLVLGVSAPVSGVIDNIPYVATMTPIVYELSASMQGDLHQNALWWALALGRRLRRQPHRDRRQRERRHARHRPSVRHPDLLLGVHPQGLGGHVDVHCACRALSLAAVLRDRMSASNVVGDGDVVLKVHRPGTDPLALAMRLRVAAALDPFLSPISAEPERVGTRWRTRWPRVETAPPVPAKAPWADAGACSRGCIPRPSKSAHAALAVLLAATVSPLRPVTAVAGLRHRRRGCGGEPRFQLSQRLEFAEVQEDSAAAVALLQMDTVALGGAHRSLALRAAQIAGGLGSAVDTAERSWKANAPENPVKIPRVRSRLTPSTARGFDTAASRTRPAAIRSP